MSLDFLSQCPCHGQQSHGTRGTQEPSNQLDQLGRFSLALALSVKQTNENSLASESYVWGEEGNTSWGWGWGRSAHSVPCLLLSYGRTSRLGGSTESSEEYPDCG